MFEQLNEFDPTKRERKIGLSPIELFDSTISSAKTNIHLHLALRLYFTDEFSIPARQIDTFYDEIEDYLPSAELFEIDEIIAKEQMRLVYMRVALPIAENTIEDDEKFREWTTHAAKKAMSSGQATNTHSPQTCLPHKSQGELLDCESSPNCPVKVTKRLLVKDVQGDNFEELDYYPSWSKQKTHRTLTKLDIARELGLVGRKEMENLYHSFCKRCKELSIHLPGNSDN